MFHREYLSVSMWGKWCKHMFQVLRARLASNFDDDIDGESPAVEVFEYRYNEKSSGETAGSLEEKGFFACKLTCSGHNLCLTIDNEKDTYGTCTFCFSVYFLNVT